MKTLLKRFFRMLGLEVSWHNPYLHGHSKRTDRLTLYKTATGNFYLPTDAKGDSIAATIVSGEVFEKDVVEVAKKYIKPNTTVLDIGSNFGQMSILFSNLVGQSGKVHAFEADDFVFSILEKNIQANGKGDRIEGHFGAVHNRSGETLHFPVQDFQRFPTYGSYGIDYIHKQGREVPTIAIDDLHFDPPISFMKIDIQGGDLFALKGAVNTIRKFRMPIIFEYEYLFEEELGLNFQEYVDFVRSIGYRFTKVLYGQSYLILPE